MEEVHEVESGAVEVPTPARQTRSRPKWETEVLDRVKAAVKKYSKPLNDLVARDANEGDTRLLITDFLDQGLGYDQFNDLTTEYGVKGDFADYGVRIDNEMIALIEVKRITMKLGPKHLRQVQMYAVNEGIEWVVLTNGVEWHVYHLTGGLPVITELALSVNLLGPETTAEKAKMLFYLTRESLKKRQIDELWKARRATSRSLSRAFFARRRCSTQSGRSCGDRPATGSTRRSCCSSWRQQSCDPSA